MNIFVVGAGLQGRAVVHDLEQAEGVTSITWADLDEGPAKALIEAKGHKKTKALAVDATDRTELVRAVRRAGAQLVVCMIPPHLGFELAQGALEAKASFVSSSYTGRLAELDGKARELGLAILPEMGLDPGIDLVLGRLAVDELDTVEGFCSYGAGLPEPACAGHNPLSYKITWTFEGVLKAYARPAQFLEDGTKVVLGPGDIFGPDHMHHVEFPSLGRLEAYPNGDALRYIEVFGLAEGLTTMGRYSFRWPGHCAFWNAMSKLGFLDESPIEVAGAQVSPQRFLATRLEPQLQFADDERDVAILRAEAWGTKDGKPWEAIYDLCDYRDLETGLFAMNRTVGFTASIGAQMLLDGTIKDKGVLSPARHVPPDAFMDELAKRNMQVAISSGAKQATGSSR